MAAVPTSKRRVTYHDERDPSMAIFVCAAIGALFCLGVWAALT
jgi:hypothetical protein